MKVLLKGYYGWGNLGDDILMKVVYNWLKKQLPYAQIDIFSGFTKNNSACKPDKHTYHSYIHKILPDEPEIIDWATHRHYDLVVQGGGGVHFDHSHGGYLYKVFNKFVKIIGSSKVATGERIVRKIFSKNLPISFSHKIGLGIGVGNFNADSKRFLHHTSFIGDYDFLWVRDQLSEIWLKELAYKGQMIKSTDLAFYSQDWLPDKSLLNKKKDKSIGLVLLVKDTLQNYHYEEQKVLAQNLIKKGYNINIYLLQEEVDQKLVPFFEEVAPVKVWLPDKDNLNDYLLDLGTNQLLISGRAHGVILGSCMGVPSITIETSTKLKEVSNMFPDSGQLIALNSKASQFEIIVDNFFMNYDKILELQKKDVESNQIKVKQALEATSNFLRIHNE